MHVTRSEELYNLLMDEAFESRCVVAVIICGPPPPTPLMWEDGDVLGAEGLKVRTAWLDEIAALCSQRWNLRSDKVGDFIAVLDFWWMVEQKETVMH